MPARVTNTRSEQRQRYYSRTNCGPNSGKAWDEKEIDMIVRTGLTDHQISELLGRSIRSIQLKRHSLRKAISIPYKSGTPRGIDQQQRESVRNRTRYRVRTGKIAKEPCADCGNGESEIHHNSYESLEDITWLCDSCHQERHKQDSLVLGGDA